MIEVDHDGRERHPDVCIVFDALGEVFFHRTAVEKVGEAVVGRGKLQSVLRRFQLFHGGADEGRHLQEMGHVLRQVDGVIGDILPVGLFGFTEDGNISRQMGSDEALPCTVDFSVGIDAKRRGDMVVIRKDVAQILIEKLVARSAGEDVCAFSAESVHILPDLLRFREHQLRIAVGEAQLCADGAANVEKDAAIERAPLRQVRVVVAVVLLDKREGERLLLKIRGVDVFIVVIDGRLMVELFDDHGAVHRGHGERTGKRAEAQDMVEHDGDLTGIDAKNQPGT